MAIKIPQAIWNENAREFLALCDRDLVSFRDAQIHCSIAQAARAAAAPASEKAQDIAAPTAETDPMEASIETSAVATKVSDIPLMSKEEKAEWRSACFASMVVRGFPPLAGVSYGVD